MCTGEFRCLCMHGGGSRNCLHAQGKLIYMLYSPNGSMLNEVYTA